MDAAADVSMLGAAWEALLILLDPTRLAILGFAALLGVILGILPGIGGLAGTALLLPFTFTMDPYTAFAFLLGLGATTATGDPIPAILFGVPGGAGSAATVLDGLPMAKRGEAGRALSAAYMSSLMGGLFGAALMGFAVPVLRPIMLHIGTPEMLAISILGLSMVARLERQHAAARPRRRVHRHHDRDDRGGSAHRHVPLDFRQPLSLGRPAAGTDHARPLRAARALRPADRPPLARRASRAQDVNHGMWQGAKDCFQNWWLVLRCSWIGAALGRDPRHRRRGRRLGRLRPCRAHREGRARRPSARGDVRGVIASESANNAKEGGVAHHDRSPSAFPAAPAWRSSSAPSSRTAWCQARTC